MPQLRTDNDIWMQDGAPPHCGRIVRDFLDDTFEMGIGRRGTTEWPPRPPDLSPCDYSMWGILKERVYSQGVCTKAELRERIIVEFAALDNERTCVGESVSTSRKEPSCVLLLKDDTLKIGCKCFYMFVRLNYYQIKII